jgi:hypothetical protein
MGRGAGDPIGCDWGPYADGRAVTVWLRTFEGLAAAFPVRMLILLDPASHRDSHPMVFGPHNVSR